MASASLPRAGLLLAVFALPGISISPGSLTTGVFAKSVFDASPADHGIVVADVRIRHKMLLTSGEADLQHGVVVPTSGAPTSEPVGGNETGGVLAFGVDPGAWRLAGTLAELRSG